MFSKTLVKLFLLHFLNVWLSEVDCVSQWDPFCNEETLYTPYVRIFQKGRSGAMLRDRGPGFIDVNGLEDIYVCTNGLVMLYYSKTKGNTDILKGEIYEHGELHWAPHHCELYNPSCTALGIDQPKKTLLSILLIGHPQDYRRPALQMFVAPTYDPVYKNYVNLTSLIMIGTEGECLLEKGVERARLRVRINEPPLPVPAAGSTDPPPERPPYFCQLDSQRKLGQQGVVNLNKPYELLFEKRPDNIYATHVGPIRTRKGETGSLIINRFKVSQVDDKVIKNKPTHDGILNVADQVYAALLNDRTMRFVGCLQYPDFSFEQEEFMKKKNLLLNGDSAATPTIDPADVDKMKPDGTADFWKDTVIPPFDSSAGATAKTRFEVYANGWNDEKYEDALAKVTTAEGDLNTTKGTPPVDPVKLKEAETKLKEEKMKFSLWPLRQRFVIFQKYAKALEVKLLPEWAKFDTDYYKGNITKVDADAATWGALDLRNLTHEIVTNLSSDRFDTRFDPYNTELVKLYDENSKNLTVLSSYLKTQSAWLGVYISNAETVFSQYNLYKELARKSLADFVDAIKKMEKTKDSLGEVENTGDIFDSYFPDTIIDISDAFTPDGSAYDTHPGSQACHALAAPIGTCKGIKPEASRACQICKNRKNQGVDWIPGTEWKQGVLDIIESIHKRVCPYISDEFAIAINRVLKGYLSASPMGTGLSTPINGSRMYKADHNYQTNVYNSTYWMLGMAIDEKLAPVAPTAAGGGVSTSTTTGTGPNLAPPPKEPFWEQIMESLQDCLARAKPLDFYYNEDNNRPTFITFRREFPNNKSEAHYDVDDLLMQEKADYEFSFNWAIDMNWRIFSTVLGYCMPHYETKIPLISAQFYALYSKHFLHPLRQIWMSNRDNPVLKTVLGSFYGTGKGERWGKICMESSFLASSDRSYRPPRYLYVNAFTEMNYFTTGPLSGTGGRLLEAVI